MPGGREEQHFDRLINSEIKEDSEDETIWFKPQHKEKRLIEESTIHL